MSEPLLALDGVSVAYGRRAAIEEVDVSVDEGSVTAVLGPSGCGKTTLLRAVAGLEPVVTGSIRLGGAIVDDGTRRVPPERRGVGLVPQDGALFPHLSVRGNIGFGLPDRATRGARVDELLDLVGLAEVADRRPAQLSGGQRQRVALARALAPSPVLIGLDEPFSALDAGLRARLREEVAGLLRRSGSTVLLVTHDPVEALVMADQVVVLIDGRVRQTGLPVDVCRSPVDIDVAALFDGIVVTESGDRLRLLREIDVVRPSG